jgi:hypothetical protein
MFVVRNCNFSKSYEIEYEIDMCFSTNNRITKTLWGHQMMSSIYN